MPSLWIYVTSILFHLQVLVCGISNHYRIKRKKSRKRAEASVRHWPVRLPGCSHLTHRVSSSVVSTIFPLYLVLVAETWSCQCAPHWVLICKLQFRVTMAVISTVWAGMVQRGLGRKGAISSLAIITTASSVYFTWLEETLPFRCKSLQRKKAFHIRKRRQSIAFQSGWGHSALVQCDSSYAGMGGGVDSYRALALNVGTLTPPGDGSLTVIYWHWLKNECQRRVKMGKPFNFQSCFFPAYFETAYQR